MPYNDQPQRWTDEELRRVLALSSLGVLVFGAAWLSWRSVWLLWPTGFSALALQISATMIAARSAVDARDRGHANRRERARSGAPNEDGVATTRSIPRRASQQSLLSIFARMLQSDEENEPGDSAAASDSAELSDARLLAMPAAEVLLEDVTQHRAFFRRVIEAEFVEHAAALAWPDLGELQGSLSTRLRLFPRYAAIAPIAAREVSDSERIAHSPWHHLAATDAEGYRRGDAIARLSHRAFAPLAFLELHARIDLELGEREALEAELLRLYTIAYGRILTPPAVLSAIEPLRLRMGAYEAITLSDQARLLIRSSGSMEDAERLRGEWHARAHATRELGAWPTEVMSLTQCLIDYWLLQRAAAADMERAEATARQEQTSIGSALAKRDAEGLFHFAEALLLICGCERAQTETAAPQTVAELAIGAAAGVAAGSAMPNALETVA